MASQPMHAPVTTKAPVPASRWPAPRMLRQTGSASRAVVAPESAVTYPPVDEELIAVATGRTPGTALELGCGVGQNSVWLAQRGWRVTAVDGGPYAIGEARALAALAGVGVAFHVADVVTWCPATSFDLVLSAFALPARGSGRSRILETAVEAVAPGGTILLRELDETLYRKGRMAEKDVVSTEELERHLGGFRIERSRVRAARRRHGFEELVLPAATVVATRRTDLRTL